MSFVDVDKLKVTERLPGWRGRYFHAVNTTVVHMDALSSAVAMKVSCGLQLTLMSSSRYRLLGAKVGNRYANAKGLAGREETPPRVRRLNDC